VSKEALAEREHMAVDYRVQIAYTVPVEVIVDLQEGRVDRVVVIGEGVALDEEEGARQESVLHPVPNAVAKRAIEVAEAGDWPVWEHGF
jgi:hypothetical protein